MPPPFEECLSTEHPNAITTHFVLTGQCLKRDETPQADRALKEIRSRLQGNRLVCHCHLVLPQLNPNVYIPIGTFNVNIHVYGYVLPCLCRQIQLQNA